MLPRALVLALLLVASPLDASSRRVRIDSARYADAWLAVQKCSARLPIAGHSLAHLVVFAVPSLTLNGHPIYALWLPGDTLLLTVSVSDTSWIVAHEMLHMLLQGPTPEHGGPHPLEPFAFPCRLMLWQRRPGGIMGTNRL